MRRKFQGDVCCLRPEFFARQSASAVMNEVGHEESEGTPNADEAHKDPVEIMKIRCSLAPKVHAHRPHAGWRLRLTMAQRSRRRTTHELPSDN